MRKRATPLVVCGLAVGLLGATAVRDLSYAGEAPAPRGWRYERMRPFDLSEALKDRPIAWLVVSPLEWHGEALSFGCDPHVAQRVADLAWEKTGGVRIPTLYLGSRFGVVERDRKVRLLRENVGRVDFDKGRRIIEYRAAQLEKQVEALVKELGLPTP